MALLRQAYSALFRRTSTFALTIVLGAVLFERAFDQGADAIFEHLNEGVRNGGYRAARSARAQALGPEGQAGPAPRGCFPVAEGSAEAGVRRCP